MRVQVGPVPSESVLMWLAYARTVIAQIITRPGSYGGVTLSAEDLAGFEAYLDEWELVANRDTTFVWSTDADADKVNALAATWYQLSEGMRIEAERRGYELLPADSRPFNDALILAVLTALSDEGFG